MVWASLTVTIDNARAAIVFSTLESNLRLVVGWFRGRWARVVAVCVQGRGMVESRRVAFRWK